MTAHYMRYSDRCTERHGFDSRRGLIIFSLFHARHKLNTVAYYRIAPIVASLIPPKPLLNNRKRSEVPSKSYKKMKNKMFIVRNL